MTCFRSCSVCVATAILSAVVVAPVAAQDGRITVGVNFGAQFGSSDFTQTSTPIIYDEAATIDVAQTASSGALFDLGGSVKLFGDFGVGVSYNHTSGDGDASVSASIPHPLYTDQPRSATTSATGLKHTENAVHVQLQYRYAISPKLDVTLGVGPSFFSVKQDLITTVSVVEADQGPVITPTVARVSESPVGFNIGADTAYMLTKSIGVGVLLRYAKSTADFAVDTSSVSVDAGGFQFAVGGRVRF
jgi:hypothetical protein